MSGYYPGQQPPYNNGQYPPQQPQNYGQQYPQSGGSYYPSQPPQPSQPYAQQPYGYQPQQQQAQTYGYAPQQPQQYPPQQWPAHPPAPPMPAPHPNYSSNMPDHPPTGAQSFGGPAGDYSFAYSDCSGKRKALLIGINYFGQRGQLRGCINDVKNMSTFLHERFNYKREDMVILTDDQQNPRSQPTKQNILQAMHWLVKDAQPNDCLFFHYSGHGGQAKDTDGDESDGYDETIYPVDFRFSGHIVDDEMHRIMVQPLKTGVRLTAIFDSCHSGSALDLPYLYSTQGTLKEPNLAKEAGMGLIGAISAYSKGDMGGVASTVSGIFHRATVGRGADERAKRTKTSPADVVQWSGSKDSQTSADATENGEATGAMSYAFIRALSRNPHQSYQQLLNSIREELSGKYSQKPQLSCSHPLGNEENPVEDSEMQFMY
ncbi:Ca(2+)-dependent cysteine protease [Rhizina undulata]